MSSSITVFDRVLKNPGCYMYNLFHGNRYSHSIEQKLKYEIKACHGLFCCYNHATWIRNNKAYIHVYWSWWKFCQQIFAWAKKIIIFPFIQCFRTLLQMWTIINYFLSNTSPRAAWLHAFSYDYILIPNFYFR